MPKIVQLLASDRELTARAAIFGAPDLCPGDELRIWLPSSERYQSGRVVDRQGNRAVIETVGERFTLALRHGMGWKISDSEN